MKSLLVLFATALSPILAQAAIQVSALHTHAESTEVESTQLIQVLKGAGAKGSTDSSGRGLLSLKGEITMTNGAACDNGHSTYRVELTELDSNDHVVQRFEMDGSNGCDQPSAAEKFVGLLGQWGGDLIQDDCGAGHCWKKIESIHCTQYPESSTPAFDACEVEMSSGQ